MCILQSLLDNIGTIDAEIFALRDSCNFLVGVCDGDIAGTVKEQYRVMDARWQDLRSALVGQSAHDYNAGLDDMNRWCDLVNANLLDCAGATHDIVCEQIEFLRVIVN